MSLQTPRTDLGIRELLGDAPSPTGAEIEYAVAVLGVREVVVCGHSACGAIKTLLAPEPPPADLRSLNAWLATTDVRELCARMPSDMNPDDVARLNALAQLDHLRSYPAVRERIERGELKLHAWFFDIASGEIESWSPELKKYVPLGTTEAKSGTSPADKEAQNVDDGAIASPLEEAARAR